MGCCWGACELHDSRLVGDGFPDLEPEFCGQEREDSEGVWGGSCAFFARDDAVVSVVVHEIDYACSHGDMRRVGRHGGIVSSGNEEMK